MLQRHFIPMIFALAVAPVACMGDPALDTRTFPLQYIDAGTAHGLIEPYVFGDRPGSPGMVSATRSTITVRETPDNLDKIARVLEEFDVASPWVRLSFQIIEANGASSADPQIADIEAELRKLFRYEGYRLAGEAVISGTAQSSVEQEIGTSSGVVGAFFIGVEIGEVRRLGDSGFVSLDVQLRATQGGGLSTRINARTGQTVVLGNAQLGQGRGTTILTVTAELVEN